MSRTLCHNTFVAHCARHSTFHFLISKSNNMYILISSFRCLVHYYTALCTLNCKTLLLSVMILFLLFVRITYITSALIHSFKYTSFIITKTWMRVFYQTSIIFYYTVYTLFLPLVINEIIFMSITKSVMLWEIICLKR